jgi:hypothetical protein
VGSSLNACVGRTIFREGVLTRSNKFFSGWSCDAIGNPDRIFTLNYDPENKREYFCRDDGKNIRGEYFNLQRRIDEDELYSLASWEHEDFRASMCRTMQELVHGIIYKERQHIHCNAGRDRTGSVVAIISAALLASSGQSVENFADIAECDYRKSKSLSRDKYGKIASLLQGIEQEYGNAAVFLQQRCGIGAENLHVAAANFLSL